MSITIKKVYRAGIGDKNHSDAFINQPKVKGALFPPVNGAQALLTTQPTEHLAARSRGTACITLKCEDGYSTELGRVGTVFSGRSAARDLLLTASLYNILSEAGSVIVLTNSRHSSAAKCTEKAAKEYHQPVRYFGNSDATPGFYPFGGWTNEDIVSYFYKCIAPEYVGQNGRPSDAVRLSINALLSLAHRSGNYMELIEDGVNNINVVLSQLEQAGISDDEAERYAAHFRNNVQESILALQILGDYVREFSSICIPNSRNERYSLFSSGATIIEINEQAADLLSSKIWYLCKMVSMLRSVAAQGITIVVDNMSDIILSKFSSMLLNEDVIPLIVYGSISAFLDTDISKHILSRISSQFVFSQNDLQSAEYWSKFSGERRILVETYTKNDSTTSGGLHFPSYTKGASKSYSEVFRPNLDVNHFRSLRENEGDLFECGTSQLFHHFSIEI